MLSLKCTCVVGDEPFLRQFINFLDPRVRALASFKIAFKFKDIVSLFVRGNVDFVKKWTKLIFCQFEVGDWVPIF